MRGIIVAAASAAAGFTRLKELIILPIPNDKTVKTPAIRIAVKAWKNPIGLIADNK